MTSILGFDVSVTGVLGATRIAKAIMEGVKDAFGMGKIENMLLSYTKMRFEPLGSNPVAQTAPDGTTWVPIAESTLARRKVNKNALQALVDTSALLQSIAILNHSGFRLGGATSFEVGLQPGSEGSKYGYFQNSGGINPQGFRVPARPFLGVSKVELRDIGMLVRGCISHRLEGV